jgi:7-cyano-7-deazaguanine synthase
MKMCSISGFIVVDPAADRARLADHYAAVLARAAERGHDSVGIVAADDAGRARRRIEILPRNYDWVREVIEPGTVLVIGNNRAEPTTEFVPYKTDDDAQPFGDGGAYVTHNGVIANDHALRLRFGIETPTRIDSAVLPSLIRQLGVRDALDEIQGSFALAAIDLNAEPLLSLARNYNPLYLQRRPDLGAIFFASHPRHLRGDADFAEQLVSPPILDVPPYHLLQIDRTGQIASHDLAPRRRTGRALIVCSGGLDSTTAARWAQLQGYDIALLHFAYRCRAQTREIDAVRAVAAALDCPYFVENLDWLGRLGGSSLTDESMTIRQNEESAEFAHEWVPARNTVFIALAAAICDRHDYDTIVLGLNLEEAGAYPDNTVEFFESFDRVCNVGTMSRPRILSPLGNLVKHEIVKLALEIAAPIDRSWSCYHGGEQHCGQCGPCFMRRKAFEMVGVPDSIHYADDGFASAASLGSTPHAAASAKLDAR